MDLILKIGRRLPDPIKKTLSKIYTSNKYMQISNFILKGNVTRYIIINKYFKKTLQPRLHVGCGHLFLDGWLNGDIIDGDIYLNATKKLPFKNNTFDFIFSEHFIEHISLNDAFKFLKECNRILKPTGFIRLTTPDLEKCINLYYNTNKFIKREELIKVVYGKESKLSPCELFNNYMHRWGHKFIWDKDCIEKKLIKSGFKEIIFCENKKSNHKELVNLERHYEDYEWLNPAETLIVEAEKPDMTSIK